VHCRAHDTRATTIREADQQKKWLGESRARDLPLSGDPEEAI